MRHQEAAAGVPAPLPSPLLSPSPPSPSRAAGRLRHADLRLNQIRSLSAHAYKHGKTEELLLDCNALTSLHGVQTLTNLVTLSCSSNAELRDATAAFALTRLRSLTLRDNGEMDERALCDASSACALPASLTHLDLSNNRMADLRNLLAAFSGRCPALRTLWLCDNPLEGETTRSLVCIRMSAYPAHVCHDARVFVPSRSRDWPRRAQRDGGYMGV